MTMQNLWKLRNTPELQCEMQNTNLIVPLMRILFFFCAQYKIIKNDYWLDNQSPVGRLHNKYVRLLYLIFLTTTNNSVSIFNTFMSIPSRKFGAVGNANT